MAAKFKRFENGMPYIVRVRGDESKFENRTQVEAGSRRKQQWRRPDVGIWLLSLAALFVCVNAYQEQRFAMEPQDQSAIVGSRVTLPCRVENKIGDYSLDIRDVTLEDDGKYQCQVSSGLNDGKNKLEIPKPAQTFASNTPTFHNLSDASNQLYIPGEPAIRSRYAQLTVLIAPDPPRIVQGAFIDATEDQPVDIECVSEGGKPAAEITWVDGNQVVIKKNVENKVELMPDEQRFKTRSVLRLLPNKAHHNQTITCQAQNTADRAYRMATVHIEIIFNVSRKHNKAVVKCEVRNAVGQNEGTFNLDVTYPPSFRSRPKNIEAEVGARVTLNCDVDGQPEPEIRWLFHEPGRIGQVKGKAPNLKVNVNNETAGSYICKATVDGYPEIESEATIFIKMTLTNLDESYWLRDQKGIDLNHKDYATLEETLSDGVVKSSLVIRASQSKHYGVYNCSVTNEYGNANAAIALKPLKTLPLFIILIGVTSGIIIFSAFVILLVICHRRRRKKSQLNEKPDVTVTTGDMYKESDRSSNISDLKLQIGQSDGSYELDYTSSDRSEIKNPAGLPLAGPVVMPNIRHDDPLMQYGYSNDYSDPTYSDPYFKNPAGYVYDYPQGYIPPPHLRVQSPTQLEVPNRSLQGSLTRSIDTTSTLPLSAGNGSQSNSLQRTNKPSDETDAINNLGLPMGGENPPTPIYAQPSTKSNAGIDLRYAATYGNPYLRNSSVGYGNQVHTAKPAATPAPPPYSAVRNSVAMPSGT
ncbi:Irregular chiasm C-roughest protein [Papilio xuthus]|uniref:Irregular chiasm C-roughest protein n=1 Tax=Papilio xuthus TaxID=66420 RepID=A0A194QH08_PAPXU|nr:Irregular chiasm C-roughest protein [Papilio xuthus]